VKKTNTVLLYLFLSVTAFSLIQIPYGADDKTAVVNNFLRVQPADSLKCPLENNVYISYDENYIYIHWDAEIDKDIDLGRFTSKDKWISSDNVRVQIITDVNSYYAYGFMAFPSGNHYDFIRKPSLSMDSKWNSAYDYTTEIVDNTWSVVMKIPFKDLRFCGSAPYKWKIILSRYFSDSEEHYSDKNLTTKMGKDYYRKASDLIIPTEVSKNENFYFRRYVIVNNDFNENDFKFDLNNTGLDFSFNPSFSTKLKLSLNPDFSDVPLDSETDTYNRRYAPSFSENRYFFIEDFNAFGVSSGLFYSRYIVQPSYALKITGNSENYSFGFLSSQDSGLNNDFGTNLNTNLYNILAFKPFTKNFSFQFTFLSKIDTLSSYNHDDDDFKLQLFGEDYSISHHNEVLHLKPTWEVSSNTSLSATLNLSAKKTPESCNYGGYVSASYSYRKGDTSVSANIMKMGQKYAADMGKLYEDDFYGWNLHAGKSIEIESEFIKKIYSNIYLSEEFDNHSNLLLERIGSAFFGSSTQHYVDFSVSYKEVREYYVDQHYKKQILSENISWDENDWFKIAYSYSQTKELIYYYRQIYDALYHYINFSGIVGKHVSYSLSLDKTEYLDFPDDPWSDDKYLLGNFDLVVNISNKISISNGVRFNNYEYYDESDHYGFFTNFSWEYKENSFFYAGYKTAEDKIGDSFESDFRSAYIKLSYSF
jgi:hypothetical protein